MATKDQVAKHWVALRAWFPKQTDRIQGDKELMDYVNAFLAGIPDGILKLALARIQARTTVYASDSIPALITQAIGDEAEDRLPHPDEWEEWVRSELHQGATQRRIEAPCDLYQEAVDACGGWWALGSVSADKLAPSLQSGRRHLQKARERARAVGVSRPSDIARIVPRKTVLELPAPESQPEPAKADPEKAKALVSGFLAKLKGADNGQP